MRNAMPRAMAIPNAKAIPIPNAWAVSAVATGAISVMVKGKAAACAAARLPCAVWNAVRTAYLAPPLLLIGLMLPLLAACAPNPPAFADFKGTPFTDGRRAADFRLTDQFGQARSLSGDFAGRPVLLTFLYTDCPDVCPIVANHLRDIGAMLQDDADAGDNAAAIVIVSVDPEGDTVDAALAYSERWGMRDKWVYLVGGEADLSAVWEAYWIDPYLHGPARAQTGAGTADAGQDAAADTRPDTTPNTANTPQDAASAAANVAPNTTDLPQDTANALIPDTPAGGTRALAEISGRIIHSAPIYLIDGEGVMRSAFTLPLAPEDVAHDVRLIGG